MYSEIGRTTAEDAARRIKHERKLYMADRSKNDQYDVVAQAEEVLRLYIKRYFDITRQMKAEKAKSGCKAGLYSSPAARAYCSARYF